MPNITERAPAKDAKDTQPRTANLLKLLDLLEAISPDDMPALIAPLTTKKIKITPTCANKLIAMLAWAHQSLSKERASEFAHRLLAFIWDKPSIGEELDAIPAEKYEAFCELLETKTHFEDLDHRFLRPLFTDNKSHLVNIIYPTLLKTLSENTALSQSFNFWVNTVLKLHDRNFNKSTSMDLKSKLEKLPTHYQQLLKRMLHVTKGDHNCVEQFFALAHALPFSEMLEDYLIQLESIPAENLLAHMTDFNELISDHPDLLIQLKSNLTLLAPLKKLKVIDHALYMYLIANPLIKSSTDVLEKIIADETLRTHLAILIEMDNAHDTCLVAIFVNNNNYIAFLSDPLLSVITHNPPFAKQLSLLYSGQFFQSSTNLETLYELMKTHSKEVIELFEITANYPYSLKFIIENMKKTFFIKEGPAGHDSHTFYHLLIDFHHAMKDTHPELTDRIMWLHENDANLFAIKFLKLYNHVNITPHRDAIWQLIKTYHLYYAATVLDKLENEPYNRITLTTPETAPLESKTTKTQNGINLAVLEDEMLSFFEGETDYSFFANELKFEHRLKLTLGIAFSLLNSDRMLDTNLIDHIKATKLHKLLDNSPVLKEHLDRLLEVLKNYPEFANVLNQIRAPKPSSTAERVIRTIADETPPDEDGTEMLAKVLALGTWLCPHTQAKGVGSCFATGPLIQLKSYREGLLLALKDYASLLTKVCIYRDGKEFLMIIDFDAFEKIFFKHSWLARAYEYTLASTAADDQSPQEMAAKKWQSLFTTEVKKHLSHSPAVSLVESTILKIAKESTLETYSGSFKHPHAEYRGSWLLLDCKTHKPFYSDEKTRTDFYAKLFKQTKEVLVKAHPELTDTLSDIFETKLHAYIQTPTFAAQFSSDDIEKENGLLRLNPKKYWYVKTTSAFTALGGRSLPLLQNCHNNSVFSHVFPVKSNPLEVLESLTTEIVTQSKERADASELMSIHCSDHGFNLLLNKLKQIFAKGSEAIKKELFTSADAVAKTQIPESIARDLIECYLTHQKYPTTEIANLHKSMLFKSINSSLTVMELCQEIIRTDRELMGKNRKANVAQLINFALRSHSAFKHGMPHIYHFADTNWEDAPNLGLSCSVDDHSFQLVSTSHSSVQQLTDWEPNPLRQWSIFRRPKQTIEVRLFSDPKPSGP